MSETDAELLSEQISMALGRLEEFRAHALPRTPCRVVMRWLALVRMCGMRHDDPTDLEFWVSPRPADALAELFGEDRGMV